MSDEELVESNRESVSAAAHMVIDFALARTAKENAHLTLHASRAETHPLRQQVPAVRAWRALHLDRPRKLMHFSGKGLWLVVRPSAAAPAFRT